MGINLAFTLQCCNVKNEFKVFIAIFDEVNKNVNVFSNINLEVLSHPASLAPTKIRLVAKKLKEKLRLF